MHNTQATSLKAYFEEVLPTLTNRHVNVLEDLIQYEDRTNMEIADDLGWSINRITPRVKELRDRKVVIHSRVRKCQSTGRNVIAWKINKFYNIENSHLKPEAIERIKQRTIQKSLI